MRQARSAAPSVAPSPGVTDPPGVDLAALAAWLERTLPLRGGRGRLSASLIPGGRSNLTFVLSDRSRTWILRRPPLGHVLATAHDMSREYRVITALRDTDVPVPETLALCEDSSVIGAPFYLMQRVEGMAYRRATELEPLGPDRTRLIAERMVDTLVALHRVDPAVVGLADFGRVEGFLARQVERWRRQLASSHTRDLPALDELYRQLASSVPAESGVAIIHGDYRLDNTLVQDDHVTAVLDWEMATLGDPLTDLALMLVYHRLSTLLTSGPVSDASLAPGFLTEAEIVARYRDESGADLTGLGFYLGLASYKLAGILEGIYYRYLAGQTVGSGFEDLGDAVVPLVEAGIDSLKEHF